jgi:hypothetical protein
MQSCCDRSASVSGAPRQIGRRCDRQPRCRRQQTRPETGIDETAEAQRHVGPLGYQVVGPIGDDQLDFQPRMTRQETRQARNHFAGAERAGHHDAQHAVEAVDPACGVRRLVEVAENATRALKKHGARIGRRDPSGGPQ